MHDFQGGGLAQAKYFADTLGVPLKNTADQPSFSDLEMAELVAVMPDLIGRMHHCLSTQV